MKILTNIKLLNWLLLFSLLLNFTIVGTIIYHRYTINNGMMQYEQNEIPRGEMMRFYREELNLTDTQHSNFRELRMNYIDNARIIQGEMKLLRDYIYEESISGNANLDSIKLKSEKLGDLHTNLKILTSTYFITLLETCDENQKPIMKNIISSMQNSHANIKCTMDRQYKHRNRRNQNNNNY